MLFQKIAIIGFGLIGSSIGRVIQENNLTHCLTCIDASRDICDRVDALGLADESTTDLKRGVQGADLVVLCTPVGVMASVMQDIADILEEGAIITDTGSVKASVIRTIQDFCPGHVEFVPGHPISGSEKSGPEAGFSALFQNRWVILTPLPQTEIWAVEKVTKLWEAGGARIEIMDPYHHDMVLGITSHLPHLIAYSIVGTASNLEEDTQEEIIQFSAGGFRDFTRLAGSDPSMWRDVFLYNKQATLDLLQRFNEDLTVLQKAIRDGDGDFLFDFFTKTRVIRKRVVESGQAEFIKPPEEKN